MGDDVFVEEGVAVEVEVGVKVDVVCRTEEAGGRDVSLGGTEASAVPNGNKD